ncbi:MAG: phospholipase D family protein [Ferrovibrio sp.]|uniref:phospholipase D family protein n=1 Tax=Ferrovibrio sp. TaxID=1917215 RepID=UPI0026160AA5|nr:phospholipase D family protein [Ferrovibrio sp.]MCW0232894.1 phospholipase D family protein [Ferrovibrio sp.]
MKILHKSATIADAFKREIENCRYIHISVAWAGTDFPGYKLLLRYTRRIKQAVIGTHFYQTDPDFIAQFIGNPVVHFVPHTNGVFHPKIFLFDRKGGGWAGLVGSANFTHSAFSRNEEVCVYLTDKDDPDGSVRWSLDDAMAHHFSLGKSAESLWLDDYRLAAERNRSRLKALGGYENQENSKKRLYEASIIKMDWPTFYADIRSEGNNPPTYFNRRIEVLTKARELLSSHATFSDIPILERGQLAGFREGEEGWGWFGSMKGAGRFKKLVNRYPAALAKALENIPMEGPVFKKHYLAYANQYQKAFENVDGIGHGLATATRLLAMKRPDYFVCLDKANKKALQEGLGFTIGLHQYEKYWDGVIAPIQDSSWWNSPRPRERRQAQAWDFRAAMLDAITYDLT